MSVHLLGDLRTEPAPRTAAHQQLRSEAPAGLDLYDVWSVGEVAVLDVDGVPIGVQTVRLPRVSTTDPEKIKAREEWRRGLRQRRT